MLAVAGKALFQFIPPPVQQIDRTGCFIREIVRPAAVSVNIVKILANRFWQQETGDGKILVVIQGKVFAVSFGFGHGHFVPMAMGSEPSKVVQHQRLAGSMQRFGGFWGVWFSRRGFAKG
jgi:hypothetical protein